MEMKATRELRLLEMGRNVLVRHLLHSRLNQIRLLRGLAPDGMQRNAHLFFRPRSVASRRHLPGLRRQSDPRIKIWSGLHDERSEEDTSVRRFNRSY